MSGCLVCRETITQPVCPKCLERQIANWLHETKPELVPVLKEKTDEIYFEGGGVSCILCHTPISICTHCYTKHIFNWIKNYDELVFDFFTFFNFSNMYFGVHTLQPL